MSRPMRRSAPASAAFVFVSAFSFCRAEAQQVSLSLDAPEGVDADVIVDGNLYTKEMLRAGKPVLLEIEPAKEHRIEVRRAGFASASVAAAIQAGEKKTISFRLEAKALSKLILGEETAPAYPDQKPAAAPQWTISSAGLFGPEAPEKIKTAANELLRLLSASPRGAEKAVTKEEIATLLDSPAASNVYIEELVMLASPQSAEKQQAQHRAMTEAYLKSDRVEEGKRFLAEHKEVLDKARSEFDARPEDVVSILMWESQLGRKTGKYRVFNTYLSQILFLDEVAGLFSAFAGKIGSPDPKRITRIRRRAIASLAAFMRQSKSFAEDPLSVTGSWAGAIGFPQFMPENLRYAADGNADGKIDLNNVEDSIMSIGRFLAEHGYRKSRKSGIYSYNPEQEYVRGVMLYADELKN